MIRLFYFFTFLLLSSTVAWAQLLPPNQLEQDACTPIILCGETFTSPYSYQGVGTTNNLTTTPCSGGENNAVWLRLNITGPGIIVFEIIPLNNADDYDFAVVNATGVNCNSLTSSNVIRCNFNNNQPIFNNGIVGLNTSSLINNVTAGTTGSSYLQQITAAAGDAYLIMINNWGTGGGPSSGFTINFAGSTATFNTDGPPEIDSISTLCDYSTGFQAFLNQPINCNSISPDFSDFYLTPSGTVANIVGANCNLNNQGYSDVVTFTFNPPLPPGTYTLHPQTGTDGNSLLDLCLEEMLSDETITFTVTPIPEYESVTLACSTITVQTNVPITCNSIAANGSDFNISGPAAVNVIGAVGVNCNANGFTNTIQLNLNGPLSAMGTYTITSQNGSDGNTLLDSCARPQVIGDLLSFDAPSLSPQTTLPDQVTTCNNTGVILPLEISNPTPGAVYNFTWQPAATLNNNQIQQPYATPTADEVYTVLVTSTDPTICPAYDTIAVHVLLPFQLLNNDTSICLGQSVSTNVIGTDPAFTYTWSPSAGVADPSSPITIITPTTTTMYALTSTYPGCNPYSEYFTINVTPVVAVDLGPDQYICPGDTAVVNASILPFGDYTYTWTPSGAYFPNNQSSLFYTGDTTITLHLNVGTDAECNGSDSITITVAPGIFANLNTVDTGLCAQGDSVQLIVDAAGAVGYRWVPSIGLSSDTIPNPLAHPMQPSWYSVYVTGYNGCKDSARVFVDVYSGAVIDLPDSVKLFPGESYEMDPGGNCLYFSWFPSSGLSRPDIANPIAQPEVRTRYFATGKTEHGCTIVDSIDILVVETVADMPNAFVPGNGTNNIFKPAVRGIVQLNSFKIFNRWGEMVYSSSDINEGWNGQYKDKPQPMGVYVYTIDAILNNGKPFIKQGNVTLIR